MWFSIFSIYTFLISNSDGKISDDSYRMIKYLHITVMVLGTIGIMIMPIGKYYSHGEMYSYGMAVSFLKIMLGIYIFVWIVRLLFNFKTIKEKKYYSIIITILMLFINIIIQSVNPAILIATFTMTYTCYIIFFTIENPDIKMAKDLAFSKEIAERFKNKTVETLNNLEDKLQGSLDEMQKFGYKFQSIIMLTYGKEMAREEYFKHGYDDYIIKPINKKSINDILIKYFKNDKAK